MKALMPIVHKRRGAGYRTVFMRASEDALSCVFSLSDIPS